jgi:glycosyltransferase
MNKGVRLAKGDIVGWLNADDFFSGPNALRAIVVAAENHAVDIVAGGVEMVSQGDVSRVVRDYSSVGFARDDLRFGFAPPHPGFYIRRGALASTGEYNLTYKIGADFDLIVRSIYVNNAKFISIPDVIVKMRLGGRSSGFSAYAASFGENYRSLKSHRVPTNPLLLTWKYVRKIKQLSSFIPPR